MDLSAPVADLIPGVRGALLEVLATLERPATRRELARLADVAPSRATAVIAELIEIGLVDEERIGSASIVRLNREHLLAVAVTAAASARRRLIERIREAVASAPAVREAYVFGSVGRGDAGRRSDVDVLVVADDPEDPGHITVIDQLRLDIERWTGNPAQIVEYVATDWQQLVEARNPLVHSVRRDGIPVAATAATEERSIG